MSGGITHPTSDLGNAERLVRDHGDELRYVPTWDTWLAWTGTHWVADDLGAAMRAAKCSAKRMLEEATVEASAANKLLAVAPEDPSALAAKAAAEAKLRWAIRSQGARMLENAVKLAASDETIAVAHAQLDADPWALNCSNGTIDLRTGDLRAHRRGDLITRLAPVAYDAKATCPTWDAFVERAMGGDLELVAYLRRIVGYALTGSTREHVLAFFFGGGANGKSTFTGIIQRLLGDYAGPAARGLLFRSRGDRHPTELAALHGKRFVVCAEIDSGASFDEALVKDLTGGDVISARRMREDFWSFAPTHKLFINGNHKPTVRGDDDGIWRRLRLVPFTVTIPAEERDKLLPDKLAAELPGILAWAVRGALEWQRDGLGDPPAVVSATSNYREESDTLGQFFDDALVFEAEGKIARAELQRVYATWCTEGGYDHPAGPKKVAERLRGNGAKETSLRVNGVPSRAWAGVRLATAGDLARRKLGVVSSHLSTQFPVSGPYARAGDTNPKPLSTSGYVTTEFDDGSIEALLEDGTGQ